MLITTAGTVFFAGIVGTGGPVFDDGSQAPDWSPAPDVGLRVDEPVVTVEATEYELTLEENRAVLRALWSSVEEDDFVGM